MTADEIALFNDTVEFGLLPASHNGSTVRLTRDRRILMRNSFDYAQGKRIHAEALAEARANHRQAIQRRWPSLAEIELEHTWGGIIAYTRNQGALFGRIADGVHGVVGADAGPVARGSITGKLLADLIVGADSALLRTQQSLGKAGLLPPEPLLGFVVRRRLEAIRREGADDF